MHVSAYFYKRNIVYINQITRRIIYIYKALAGLAKWKL